MKNNRKKLMLSNLKYISITKTNPTNDTSINDMKIINVG